MSIMKFKGKYEKISPLAALYTAVGLLIAAVPFRMYQLLNIIEADTGFYKREDWSVYVMYVLGALAIALCYILATLSKNIPASKSPYRKNKLLAIASFIFAGGILLDVVSAFSTFLVNSKSLRNVDMSILSTLNQGQLPLLFESVLGVFATIYIIVFGISYIDGRTTYSQYKFLAITPLFWAMSRIVLRFLTKIAYVNISDLLIEIFMLAIMMIFLLNFARISVGLSNKGAMRTVFATGTSGMFFCLVANLPRLIMIITGNGAKVPSDYPFSLADFGFAVFAVAYILNAIASSNGNDLKELESKEEKNVSMEIDDDFLSE